MMWTPEQKKEYLKIWRIKNHDKVLKMVKIWKSKNKEKVRQYNNKSRIKNKEYYNLKRREFILKNPEYNKIYYNHNKISLLAKTKSYQNKMFKNEKGKTYKNFTNQRVLCLLRDDYKCINCGSSYKLNIHHFLEIPNHELNNLVTLCVKCHRLEHSIYNSKQKENLDISILRVIFSQYLKDNIKGSEIQC
jgi:hypothetical protein